MILQALYNLYQRLPDVDQPGFAPMGLSWAVVLNSSGELIALHPLRKKADRGNKLVPTNLSAPSPGKRTAGDKPGFLADKTDYVFGFDPTVSNAPKATAKLIKRFALFREQHLSARQSINHPDFDLVCKFLENWNPEATSNAERISKAANAPLEDVIGSNLAFQISGKRGFVHELKEAKQYWAKRATSSENNQSGFCLVTGSFEPLARLHDPAIKGVVGAQSSGASIVSFNLSAFSSHSKEQSLNAPVSEDAAFGYCTALNWLLSQKTRRFRIGDATAVFWTAEPSAAETLLPWMFSGTPEGEDKETKERVANLLEKVSRGTLSHDDLGDLKTEFYVLGLSPNASRLSVRFWHTGTIGNLIDNIRLHLNQLEIIRQKDDSTKYPDPLYPSVYQLLRQTAREADGIPPHLGGALMRSILLGTKYPNSLPSIVINRIRAERDVPYLKAAILKAWLTRNHLEINNRKAMTKALDSTRKEPAYHLGRLFAVYEHAQNNAHDWKLERTIRHTMYSAASATPLSVFGRLERLHHHHTAKKSHPKYHESVPKNERLSYVSIVQDIQQHFKGGKAVYPATLSLANQSFFAVGYYHQLQHFKHLSFEEQQESE